MNAAAFAFHIRLLLVTLHLLSKLHLSNAGMCWTTMLKNERCLELLNETTTKEECCGRFGITAAWSEKHMDSSTLFFMKVLEGGVPCIPCKESCAGINCGPDKTCVLRKGRPKCICSPSCKERKHRRKGPVCGTDGKSYKNICRLKKRACRRKSLMLTVAYNGMCQKTCDRIQCPTGKQCLLDQNLSPHCVKCERKCNEVSPKRQVCGSDGLTYPSTCHVRQKACRKGKAIPVAYKGQCKQGATCNNVRCKSDQICLNDLVAHSPRCVTCSHRCKPRHMSGPLCGTNNSTYQSWCHMVQDSCVKGYVIDTKYSGRCAS